ncbi:MAG: hypothetical protein JEZ14_08965 [Marinilabiliaceae bacterium]|nr:hypothetical protein [Marinilabiliaceae bacterium]
MSIWGLETMDIIMLGIIILVFLGAIIWLGLKSYNTRTLLKAFIASPDDNGLTEGTSLYELWKLYQASFLKSHKTLKPANAFFRMDTVMKSNLSLSNVTGTLVGLGIFGTFLGLTMGLINMNFDHLNDSEQTIQGIKLLLGGIQTAFITSIAGMGLSVIYGIVFKLRMGIIYDSVSKLQLKLDQKYLLTSSEMEAHMLQNQKDLMADFFGSDQNGVLIKPGARLNEIHLALQATSDNIDTLANDIAESLSENLSADIQEAMKVALDNMVDEIRKVLGNINTEGKGATEDLAKNITEAIDDLTSSFTESLEKPINALGEKMDLISGSLNKLPAVVDSMEKTLDEVLNRFKSQLAQSDQLGKEQISELENWISELSGVMDNLKGNEKQLTNDVSQLLGAFKSILENSTTVNTEMQNTIMEFNNSSQTLQSLHGAIDSTSMRLSQNTDKALQVSQSLGESANNHLELQNQGIIKLQEVVKSSDEAIANTLSKTVSTMEQHTHFLEKSGEAIAGSFEVITRNINDYNETTKDALNAKLSDFTSQLRKATEQINDSYREMGEILEEIVNSKAKSN